MNLCNPKVQGLTYSIIALSYHKEIHSLAVNCVDANEENYEIIIVIDECVKLRNCYHINLS